MSERWRMAFGQYRLNEEREATESLIELLEKALHARDLFQRAGLELPPSLVRLFGESSPTAQAEQQPPGPAASDPNAGEIGHLTPPRTEPGQEGEPRNDR
jgi:hypothetical protein